MRWWLVAACFAVIWSFTRYQLLHPGPRFFAAMAIAAALAIAAMAVAIRRVPQLWELRRKRRMRFVLQASVSLTAGVPAAVFGAAAFCIANGLYDGGAATAIPYDVVSGPTRGNRRHGPSIGLRSRDGRNHFMRLTVPRADRDLQWVGSVVALNVKPGRLGTPWIDSYIRVDTSAPTGASEVPVSPGPGKCSPRYERMFGRCE